MISSHAIRFAMSIVASVLARLITASRGLTAPFTRLWRLASLRSRASGPIPLTTQFDGATHTAGRVRVALGDRCRLGRGVFFETQEGGRIELGAHVRINMGSVLVSYSQIVIGNHCLIGEYVSIRDADHGTDLERPMRLQDHHSEPITIEDNVWIGRGAVILKGVKVGTGAIIGANSVITRDVPENTIVAGVPARVVRERGEPAGA